MKLFVFLFLLAFPASSVLDPIEIANDFAREYNEWAQLIQDQAPGTLDARAVLRWSKVRHKFDQLDRAIRELNSPIVNRR